MTFFIFLWVVLQIAAQAFVFIILPLTILSLVRRKFVDGKTTTQAVETVSQVHEEIQYKVNIMRCRAYLKSRGIKTIY